MQASRSRAAGMASLKRADELPDHDHIADAEARCHRLIGGAQAARMRDADNAATGQPARIDDRPGSSGVHGRRWWRGKIDAAMTGEPGLGRWIERAHDMRRVNRPPEASTPHARHSRTSQPTRPGGNLSHARAASRGGRHESPDPSDSQDRPRLRTRKRRG